MTLIIEIKKKSQSLWKKLNSYDTNFIDLRERFKNMENLQNVDFNNPSMDIIFALCMENLKGFNENFHNKRDEIDMQSHRDLLVRYGLQSYSDSLIDYQIKWFDRSDSLNKWKRRSDNYDKNELTYHLKISGILKMFLSRELNHNSLRISITDLFDKIDIGNINLINQVQGVIIKEFERLKLNETEYTRDEALEAIKLVDDPEWLGEFASGDCFDGITVYHDFITENLIEDYMFVHYKTREITLDLVTSVENELETSLNEKKGKVGAKVKNLYIGELAKRLSYIHRIPQFLNQNICASIKDFPLSNETCRFIYEYFDFWDLLYEHVKFDISEKEKRTSYIKSLIRNNLDAIKKEKLDFVKGISIIDTNLEIRIDSFKNVKDGIMTPDEFYEIISTMKK